jgi:hypothetical protein
MTTPPDNDEVHLTIDVDTWKCFVVFLGVLGFIVMMAQDSGRMSTSAQVTKLVSLIVVMTIITVVGGLLLPSLLRFYVTKEALYREFLNMELQRKALSDVKVVWRFFPASSARTRIFERGFMMPNRFLMTRASREALSAFAKDHLDESHPLYKRWVR